MAALHSTLSVSTATAMSELEELIGFCAGKPAAERALFNLYHEKGGDLITFHKANVKQPFHLEAVLCPEAQALLQAWRAA